MSDKACLTNAELEFTQRLQMHFPRGILSDEVLCKWNGCKAEIIAAQCLEAFGKFPEPEPKTEPLLELIGTVAIPATTKKFVASDHFVKDTGEKAKVKISYLGDNFKAKFLGKVEEPMAKTILRYHKLRKGSVDEPILAELGGQDKAETTLFQMLALMAEQGNGEDGILLTNGYANIFYIRDINGVFWAVRCPWSGDVWYVRATSVGPPRGWHSGPQVFSRNSFES